MLLSLSLLASAGSAAAPDRPNVLLVVVDDLRFDDFAAAGHPFARTPHIDRLASILTGLYTRHHGILANTERSARSHERQNLIDSASSSDLRRRMEGELEAVLEAPHGVPAPRRQAAPGHLPTLEGPRAPDR